VWRFFREHTGTIVYYDSGIGAPDHEEGDPSHECTKFPWATRDLENTVLAVITGGSPNSFMSRIQL